MVAKTGRKNIPITSCWVLGQPPPGAAAKAEGVEYFYEGLKVSDIVNEIISTDKPEENKVESDRCIADGMRYEMNKTLPKELAAAIAKLASSGETVGTSSSGGATEPKSDALPFEEWGRRLAELARHYPCMAECFDGLDQRQYPAALFVSGALFGTLMTRCYYHFYHNPTVQRRLNYCIYIIGDPGCGKSFAHRLYRLIASSIIAADEVGQVQINNYKKAMKEHNTKKDSKKGEGIQYPDVQVRIHGVRTSNSVFIEDMYYAIDDTLPEPMHLHMLTFDAELDSLAVANRGGQFIDKTTFELKAFHNEEDNQQYKNL